MRGLDAVQILAAWERADQVTSGDRARELLRAAGAAEGEHLDALPVGRRDALLLALHRDTFSDALDAVTRCPACGTAVELTTSCAALLAQADAAAPVRPLTMDGYAVSWRPPTIGDLAAVSGSPDPDEAALRLLDRCVLAADGPAGSVPPAALPEGVRAALTAEMAAADPLVEVLFDLTCPDCSATWQAGLDPAAFVWAKVSARAEQLLREVDALARAYGWSEPQILALSASRRAAYLRLVSDG